MFFLAENRYDVPNAVVAKAWRGFSGACSETNPGLRFAKLAHFLATL
jgi:hypothetical protein